LGALVDSETPVKASCSNLDKIVAEAYANLSATSLLCWRRLHTDASILGALVSQPLDAIAKLDTAIIVSGAAGEGRLDLILDIIQHIQKDLPSFCDTSVQTTAEVFERQVAATPSRERAIPCLVTPPSLTAFQSRAHKAPFILRAYARDWPALNDHPWASIEYLRSVAGPGRVVPVEVGQDYRTDDWSQKIIGWDEFLASLDSEDGPPLYLAQHSLFMQFPALRADIQVPDYVYADVPRQTAPPSNDEQLVINAWLGPRDTISPAHTVRVFSCENHIVF
jgi:lysine-specific demethylase 8